MKYGRISKSVDIESFNNADTISATFFYKGCNFYCGFCHNYHTLKDADILSEEHILERLRLAKNNWIKTIVVSGGEPTLDKGLPAFLNLLKKWDFQTKLDTNGSNPEVLEKLISKDLVDYIAMDIKGCKDQYKEIAGYDNLKNIQRSIDIVRGLDDYEFRTTVVPCFHGDDEIKRIGEWLDGSKLYVLQQFRPDLEADCMDPKFNDEKTYSRKELNRFAELVKDNFEEVKVKRKYEGG